MKQEITAQLTDEAGEIYSQTFLIERKFKVKQTEYLALIPKENDDDVYLFRFQEKNSHITLLEIESDEEYDEAAQTYETLLANEGA